MKTTRPFAFFLVTVLSIFLDHSAWAGTFGSGANSFVVDFVTIGDPLNAPDTSGNPNPVGSVAQTFRIGKYEVSEQMIDKANTLGGLGITKDNRGPDKPATGISWNEAARFINWLNTSTQNQPAYKFEFQPGDAGYNVNANAQEWGVGDLGYDPSNVYRNSQARFFLPSTDEWYKAAYYDAANSVYYDYPTGSNSAPTGVGSGTAAGTAVYTQPFGNGPADVTLAGGLSPYGTMGQGGNVFELEESDFNLTNAPTTDARGLRGGYWSSGVLNLSSANRLSSAPGNQQSFIGFRVAAVIPEPSTAVLIVCASLSFFLRRKAVR